MLVNCAAYQDGKKLADIARHEVSDYLERHGCFVWVALLEPNPEELNEMAEEFHLHPLAVEDASHGHQRPKIEEYGDCLFAVLHTVESVSSEDSAIRLVIGEVDLFVGHNYLLSVRKGTRVGFAEVRARAEREPDLLRHGAGFVFYALIDNVVDRYFPVLDHLQSSLEQAEDELFEGAPTQAKIARLYELRRDLMTLKHAVLPLVDAVGKLCGGRVPPLCSPTQEYFRDVEDHLTRINTAIDSMREMATAAIQVKIALISLAESEVTKRLAAWGALITVPTLIAGIYGMNFANMPELKWTFGYPIVLGLMLVLDAALYLRLKRANWL